MKNLKNEIISSVDGVCRIDVSTKTHQSVSMMIDEPDLAMVVSAGYCRIYAYKAGSKFYACCAKDKKRYYLHRLLIPVGDDEFVDHINHDGLDNRSINLRAVNCRESVMNIGHQSNNTSGRMGVYKKLRNGKWNGRWSACIKVNYKFKSLGEHDTFEEAVAARAEAEIKYGFHPNHGKSIIV